MSTSTAATRTWLCPDCEGWGVQEFNTSHDNDPQCDVQEDCFSCDSSGVIEASYAEGERQGLTPWSGSTGKSIEGVRAAKRSTDPLLDMGRLRADRGHPLGGSFYYGIYRMRAMRKCSGLAQADMLAMAARCVTATENMQAAYRQARAA